MALPLLSMTNNIRLTIFLALKLIPCYLFALSAKSSCYKRRYATKYNTVDTSTEFNEHRDDSDDEQPLQEL